MPASLVLARGISPVVPSPLLPAQVLAMPLEAPAAAVQGVTALLTPQPQMSSCITASDSTRLQSILPQPFVSFFPLRQCVNLENCNSPDVMTSNRAELPSSIVATLKQDMPAACMANMHSEFVHSQFVPRGLFDFEVLPCERPLFRWCTCQSLQIRVIHASTQMLC